MVSGSLIVEAGPMTTSSNHGEPARFDREQVRTSAATLRDKRHQLAGPAAPLVRGWAPLQTAMHDALTNPPKGIADVLAIQVTVQAILDQLPPSPANNRVAAFNKLYLTITRRVDTALQTTAHWPEFLEMLDVEFAKRYFLALDLWNRDQPDTPDVWEVLFRRAGDMEVSELIAATLGVNAHINHDLSLALIGTWKEVGAPTDDIIHPDYLLVNEIFYQEIPPLRRGFSTRWQNELDALVGPLDDWSQRLLVRVTRAHAWDQGRQLWELRNDPEDFEEARRAMDRAASLVAEWAIAGDRLVNGAGWGIGGTWRFMRKVLGRNRRPPAATHA